MGEPGWKGTHVDGFGILLQAWLWCHCFLTRQRPQVGILVSVWTLLAWKLLFGALTATRSLCPASQALARPQGGLRKCCKHHQSRAPESLQALDSRVHLTERTKCPTDPSC